MTATYTAPKTMTNEPVLYADWNTYVRDNIEYLKQQADSFQIILPVIGEGDTLSTGDGQKYLTIPAILNTYNLTAAHACVYTPSTDTASSDIAEIQIYNLTDTQDMLSTTITIDGGEYSSYTAATAPVIDATKDDVATGDRLRIDVDKVAAGTKGLEIHLLFRPA